MIKNYAMATIENRKYDPRKRAKIFLRKECDKYYWFLESYGSGCSNITGQFIGFEHGFKTITEAQAVAKEHLKYYDLKDKWKISK